MQDDELKQHVMEALATYDTSEVFVEVKGGVVHLAGQVGSDGTRREIGVAIAQVEGVREIRNEMQVEPLPPGGARIDLRAVRPSELRDEGSDVVGQGTEYDLNEDIGSTDAMRAASEAEPFVPPTDPVVRPAPEREEGYDVVGGFAATSMDSATEGAESVSSVVRGDEAIADDVRRELREDSLTTDLEIRVVVRRGVVYLYGAVATLDDAVAAEEVASRVPGVMEVREKLEVVA
jgi:osmotically-inducible protein OsmY